MKKRIKIITILIVLLLLATSALQIAIGQEASHPNKVLNRALNIELGRAQPAPFERLLSSGPMYVLLQASGELERRAEAQSQQSSHFAKPKARTLGCQKVFKDAKGKRNIRVNQDCSLRRQSEEVIAINPTNPQNFVAGQNDSRIGFNHCGYDFSFNGGRTWGDMIPPFWQFLLADGHTSDACSDPTATFDAGGNAYVGGILFDVASPASAFVVAKSNAPIGGAFYHSPAAVPFQEYLDAPLGVVASDSDPNIFNDKEFIVADSQPDSPKQNNVYATWTRYELETGEGVDSHSPIYFSQSTDGGATWSTGIEISGSNPSVCTDFSGSVDPNACDQDQGSHPVVGPDGSIYVVFGNGNTPELGKNQVMAVSCPGTADCSDPASWTTPVKVGNLIDFNPIGPDSVTGCPAGRQCIPPNGYRVSGFTFMSISVDDQRRLYVVWSDSRNLKANCNPLGDATTAVPPCDNDVFYSYSTDDGSTWSRTRRLTQLGSAQWQPWSAVVQDGSRLWVAYYDRSYGDCEFTGCNDITLVSVENPASTQPKLTRYRLTTSSMPNLVMANNPVQAGFLGDYMWVTVDNNGRPHVVWSDTRGLEGNVEEDIYYATYP